MIFIWWYLLKYQTQQTNISNRAKLYVCKKTLNHTHHRVVNTQWNDYMILVKSGFNGDDLFVLGIVKLIKWERVMWVIGGGMTLCNVPERVKSFVGKVNRKRVYVMTLYKSTWLRYVVI